jgi:hypothetical protein
MRKCFTLLLLLGCAWPAMAAKTVNIEQVEQLLTRLKGKPDEKVAHDLQELHLTERVSPPRLARWQAEFPGIRSQQELMRLADTAAFLEPPAADAIPDPRPDTDTQRHMLWMAEQYAASSASQLPDLSATRQATHFEAPFSGDPDSAGDGTKPMQRADAHTRTVTFRNGREVPVELAGAPDHESALGLTAKGEFGPMVSQVMNDVLQAQTVFLRWEQGPGDPAAVFYYNVPGDASHFDIDVGVGSQLRTVHPAYQGEIEIDPETGAILRLTEVAVLPRPLEAERVAIEVEYAPVTIGDRTCICPAKSVVLSRMPKLADGAPDRGSSPLVTQLNDIEYSEYHELRSEHSTNVDAGSHGETSGEHPQ